MVQRLRQLGWVEGLSLIVLVAIAVPLKYMGGMPIYVRVVGPIHGFFFTIYCIQLVLISKKLEWSMDKALLYFVAALIPFGMLMVDKRLKAEETPHQS